ncbi:hypothetical protein F2Q69_00013099 [Brassica cretica]|uniref:Uncharacterized protein n=1 Tax=Brassica cretica TaxID=69181 RepID=A0A8S9R1S5_BRACR|nr:hypothetical protein F2Q69_00013099 [Brassica cretica]
MAGNHEMGSLWSSGDSIEGARSLRSDRAFDRYVATKLWFELGRYVAIELCLELGRYVATELLLELDRYVATELWLEPSCYVATEQSFGSSSVAT